MCGFYVVGSEERRRKVARVGPAMEVPIVRILGGVGAAMINRSLGV